MSGEQTKNVLFCGAARGPGREIAEHFRTSGWNTIIIDLVQPEQNNLEGLYYYQCDLSNFERSNACIQEIMEKFPTIEVLINCIRYRKNKNELIDSASEWKKALECNLDSYFNTSSIICEKMKDDQSPCSIINISSVVSDLVTLKESISYHAAKSAVNQMTKYLAVQYGPYGIRANTISPGLISNQGSEKSSNEPGASLYAKYALHLPLRRSGAPREVANLVLFLASEASSFITGQNIVIHGGLSICEHLGILPAL